MMSTGLLTVSIVCKVVVDGFKNDIKYAVNCY